jgi:hypothetical protein
VKSFRGHVTNMIYMQFGNKQLRCQKREEEEGGRCSTPKLITRAAKARLRRLEKGGTELKVGAQGYVLNLDTSTHRRSCGQASKCAERSVRTDARIAQWQAFIPEAR